MITPIGTVLLEETDSDTPEVANSVMIPVTAGSYIIEVTTRDIVGNLATASRNVIVNDSAPIITFSTVGYENGWWLNPLTNEVIFTVISGSVNNVEIDDIDVIISILDSENSETIIQETTPLPTANANEYSVNFAQLQLPNAIGLKVTVVATDELGLTNQNEQLFALDYADPIIEVTSPVGDPAEVVYGTDAQIVLEFDDIAGTFEENNVTYNSGASGIDITTFSISLDNQDVTTEGTISANGFILVRGDLNPGTHTLVASISDFVGNVGSKTHIFEVIDGPAPVVVFNPLANNSWWISPASDYALGVNISSGHAETVISTVTANIYQEPANTVIQGPIAIAIDQAGNGEINFHGSILEDSQNAIRIEVVAVNGWDNESTFNQTYPIDRNIPVLTIDNPVEDSSYLLGTTLNVVFHSTDLESGLDITKVKVIKPDTSIENSLEDEGELDVTTLAVDLDLAGTYIIEAIATDNVGNIANLVRTFEVNAPKPVIEFDELTATGGWINTSELNEIVFTVDGNGAEVVASSVTATVVAMPENVAIMGPSIVTINSDDNYVLTIHGGIIPIETEAISIIVNAENIVGGANEASHSYPIDNIKPELTIINPTENSEFMIGTSLVINVQAMDSHSGLLSTYIEVFGPDGVSRDSVLDLDTPETTSLEVEFDTAGIYTIETRSSDIVGNIISISRTVSIDAPNPIITFGELVVSNGWINVSNNNYLTFDVDGNGLELASAGVEVSVVAIPSDVTILGPVNGTLNPDGSYSLTLHGGVIPNETSAIRMVVTAENIIGGVSESSHSYPVDSYCPTIVFVSPEQNSIFTEASGMSIDVLMELSDIETTSVRTKQRGVSGLDSLVIHVTNQDGEVILQNSVANVANSYLLQIPVSDVGQHVVTAVIYDRAGNSSTRMLIFSIEGVVPDVDLEFTAKPYMYPSPLARGSVGTFVIPTTKAAKVVINIYDFSGKLVRTIANNLAGGTSDLVISFDGTTDDGKKLARGAYFAKVSVVDGAKEINRVVKIAIK